jgi:fructosamine-3-kinase
VSVATAVARALGVAVGASHPIGGGDVGEGWRLDLADGRTVYAKTRAGAPPGIFSAEAAGLRWLAAASALPVPEVLAVADGPMDDHPVLVLPWIQPARSSSPHDEEAFGRGLAALHRAGAPTYGFSRNGFIGPLPLDNRPTATWAAFWWERRIEPFLRMAVDAGAVDLDGATSISELEDELDDLVGPSEPIARLHGDLWGGNVHWSDDPCPWLIDPSAYGGRREVDLAMLGLFGGVGRRAMAAYHEAWPLGDGYEDRVQLYQLYPLLVHAVLFGGGYGKRAVSAAEHYLS